MGTGAVYAALGLGLLLTYRASGVVNFAHGAVAMYATYIYVGLRVDGQLDLPGVRVDLGGPVPAAAAAVAAVFAAALVGLVLYAVVFHPLRRAPALARVVASVGVMIALQAAVVLQFGSDPLVVPPVLPARPVRLLGVAVPRDRLWLAGVAVAAAAGLWALFRFTRFGLASRAAAEDETALALTGWSPTRVAACNWVLAAALAGLGGILVGPITALDPLSYTLLVVPALAAALVGGLSSFGGTVAAALGLGMLQSELVEIQSHASWLPATGVAAALPLLLVAVVAVARGRLLPARALPAVRRLPKVGLPARPLPVAAVATAAGVVLMSLSHGEYRLALVNSAVAAIVCLSIVVLTGYLGQLSLAQMAFAGVAGFSLSKLNHSFGVPFPLDALLAAVLAAVAGLAIGLPALRVRGAALAVVTLAGAVAVESLLFQNVAFTGGFGGVQVKPPSFAGADLSPFGSRAADYPRLSFALLTLTVLVGAALGVAALRRGRWGRRLLAVRANERAAEAAGVGLTATKLAGFGASAFVAGLAGAMIGFQQGRISFDSFGVFVSLTYVALAYVGGIGTISGAVAGGLLAAGGIVFSLLDRAASFDRYHLLASGLALVAIVVLGPDGLAVWAAAAVRRIPWRRTVPPRAPRGSAEAAPVAVFTPAGRAEGSEPPGRAEPPGWSPARKPLELAGVTVAFGRVEAVSDVSFRLEPGTVTGLIGPNGAGKTTLLDAVTGFVPLSGGTVTMGGVDLTGPAPHRRVAMGLGRTFQSLELFDDLTVAENLRLPAEAVRAPTGSDRRAGEWAGVAAIRSRRAGALPHSDRRAVALARAVASGPDVLLLDEPAAGLSAEERGQLMSRLRGLADAGVTVLLVEHDLELVLRLCDRVLVLDFGRLVADGPPAQVRSDPRVLAAYLGRTATPAAAPAEHPAAGQPAAGTAATPATPAQPAVEVASLTAGYAGVPVVRDVSLRVEAGEVVALLGPNGAGKSTTLLAVSGVVAPMAGTVRLFGEPAAGEPQANARRGVAHVLESRGLFGDLTVAEHLRLADRGGGEDALDWFPALRPLLRRKAVGLSGGEQQMLAVARALASRPRLLVVDELTLGLAPTVVEELLSGLRTLAAERGTAVLFAEQHPRLALSTASRAYVMAAGRVVLERPTSELARRPDLLEAGYLGRVPGPGA